MSESLRKKSPRAPSMALDEAIDKALRVYEKERRHPAPADLVAKHMGYKGANSGSALQAMASMRYYGLMERQGEGKLAVAKEVESYKFAPSEEIHRELLIHWLKAPQIFADLLEKYHDGLPSDANLRYELIQRGFLPIGAESLIPVFRKSVEFARYFESAGEQPKNIEEPSKIVEAVTPELAYEEIENPSVTSSSAVESIPDGSKLDKIPVRLSGGRRAWLVIPEPFFDADKKRLKDQIDLLLTEDEVKAQ